jgi:hypothetical protein
VSVSVLLPVLVLAVSALVSASLPVSESLQVAV